MNVDEAINPTWIGDLKLLLRDCWFFGRDTVVDAIHLIARGIKVAFLISVWFKSLSSYIEVLLHNLRVKTWWEK